LEYYDAINSEILSFLDRDSSGIESLVQEAVSNGKRTRSILCLLWCEALSGNFRPAVPVAAAYELAHVAALIEDDVIDGSRKKFGKETVPAKYDITRAILVSNTLLFCAPPLLARYASTGGDPIVTGRLLELLGNCGRLSAKGEFLDLEMSRSSDVSEDRYLQMVAMKTGALIGASSASGALIGWGKIDNEIIEAAYSFGECLGVAYQIRDDLQDFFGIESETGKATFSDLHANKKTLPLIHCLKFCTEDERNFVNSLSTSTLDLDQSGEERLRSLLAKYESDEYCRKAALKFVEKAKSSLSFLNTDSRAKDRLFEVVDYFSSTC
jgi:octaprenyl-diphosphate synthase